MSPRDRFLKCLRCNGYIIYRTRKPVICPHCHRRFRVFSKKQQQILCALLELPLKSHEEVSKRFDVTRRYVSKISYEAGLSVHVRRSFQEEPAEADGFCFLGREYLKSIGVDLKERVPANDDKKSKVC